MSEAFGRVRSFLWPIYRSEMRMFLPLFLIFFLVGFNYSVLRATKDELDRPAVIAINCNVRSLYPYTWNPPPDDDFLGSIMILIDIFQEPKTVKIVRPNEEEVQWAPLGDFDKNPFNEFS